MLSMIHHCLVLGTWFFKTRNSSLVPIPLFVFTWEASFVRSRNRVIWKYWWTLKTLQSKDVTESLRSSFGNDGQLQTWKISILFFFPPQGGSSSSDNYKNSKIIKNKIRLITYILNEGNLTWQITVRVMKSIYSFTYSNIFNTVHVCVQTLAVMNTSKKNS